jgi:hypothetical protein
MNNWCISWLFTHILMVILILKGSLLDVFMSRSALKVKNCACRKKCHHVIHFYALVSLSQRYTGNKNEQSNKQSNNQSNKQTKEPVRYMKLF